MLPNFTRHLSPMPQLHSVTFGIGCLFPSVASRFRLRLRGTLPHPRILLSFFPCIIDASRPPNKETPYLFLSRDHKAAAAAARRRRERLVAVCVVCVFPSASRPSPTPRTRAPGTQKPREKLLTFQRHSVDLSPTKHQPLCSAITINTS